MYRTISGTASYQTLRRLAYFATIADVGSIRGAASRLGLSVPVVSTALAELEAEHGNGSSGPGMYLDCDRCRQGRSQFTTPCVGADDKPCEGGSGDISALIHIL
ncbi:MAG: LysR family transcriptional regulator [Cyanobacteria bacterium P01_F01_bin.150]